MTVCSITSKLIRLVRYIFGRGGLILPNDDIGSLRPKGIWQTLRELGKSSPKFEHYQKPVMGQNYESYVPTRDNVNFQHITRRISPKNMSIRIGLQPSSSIPHARTIIEQVSSDMAAGQLI